MSRQNCQENSKKKIRVWVDGCFDIMHFGHANALRQAKQLGGYLVVGVHSDEEVRLNKGPPVFTEEERYQMVRSIKWVDEVVEAAPYVTQIETLDKYDCDFCAHGDDITFSADGSDTYEIVKNAGRYKEFKRTEGVSTTDLVGRMLLATRTHHSRNENINSSPWTASAPYMPNTLRIMQFGEDSRDPLPGEKIIYAPGAFDMFHCGHVAFLERCKEYGSYIIVGVYSDATVNEIHGMNYPIMNIHERVLSVLANRYVSNSIIGAPLKIDENLLKHFKIDLVIVGERTCSHLTGKDDPFEVPKRLGIFKEVDSGCDLSTRTVMNRIINNRMLYEERNKKKEKKELAYIEQQKVACNQ